MVEGELCGASDVKALLDALQSENPLGVGGWRAALFVGESAPGPAGEMYIVFSCKATEKSK